MLNFWSKKIRLAVRSPKWSTLRKQHLINQPNCQACNRTTKLEVHHKIPVHIDSTKELDPENLITLCDTCHFVFGHLLDWKSWNTNVVKDVLNFYRKVQNRP